MKKIKYKISKNEAVGNIPEEAMIDVFLIMQNDNEGLIYIPRKVSWELDGIKDVDKGCASLSLAQYDKRMRYWVRSQWDYINLTNANSRKFEQQIKKA